MARPKVAILSKSLIRDQALSIINEEGLDALTMRRLAGRVGVQQSVDSYFPSKDAVLDAVVDRLAKNIDPNEFDESWQVGISTWANSYYDVIHLHPSRIFAGGTPERSQHVSMADQIHGSFLAHGWPERAATMAVAANTSLVLGAATTTFGSGLVVDSQSALERCPNLSRAQLLKNITDSIDRDSFTLALQSLIRGLEPLHAALDSSPSTARYN